MRRPETLISHMLSLTWANNMRTAFHVEVPIKDWKWILKLVEIMNRTWPLHWDSYGSASWLTQRKVIIYYSEPALSCTWSSGKNLAYKAESTRHDYQFGSDDNSGITIRNFLGYFPQWAHIFIESILKQLTQSILPNKSTEMNEITRMKTVYSVLCNQA